MKNKPDFSFSNKNNQNNIQYQDNKQIQKKQTKTIKKQVKNLRKV